MRATLLYLGTQNAGKRIKFIERDGNHEQAQIFETYVAAARGGGLLFLGNDSASCGQTKSRRHANIRGYQTSADVQAAVKETKKPARQRRQEANKRLDAALAGQPVQDATQVTVAAPQAAAAAPMAAAAPLAAGWQRRTA